MQLCGVPLAIMLKQIGHILIGVLGRVSIAAGLPTDFFFEKVILKATMFFLKGKNQYFLKSERFECELKPLFN